MKTKNIITLLLILTGLGGLMWWSRPAQTSVPIPGSNTGVGSALTVAEKLYDFGTISMADGNVIKTFKITNSSSENIVLKTITTSCMCTTAYLESTAGEKGPFGMPGHGGPAGRADEIIKAGESRDVKVVYDPNAHGPAGIGPVDRFVYLTEVSGGTLELEIKAVVTP